MKKNVLTITFFLFFFSGIVISDETRLEDFQAPGSTETDHLGGRLIFGNGGGFEFCVDSEGRYVLQALNLKNATDPCSEPYESKKILVKADVIQKTIQRLPTISFEQVFSLSHRGRKRLEKPTDNINFPSTGQDLLDYNYSIFAYKPPGGALFGGSSPRQMDYLPLCQTLSSNSDTFFFGKPGDQCVTVSYSDGLRTVFPYPMVSSNRSLNIYNATDTSAIIDLSYHDNIYRKKDDPILFDPTRVTYGMMSGAYVFSNNSTALSNPSKEDFLNIIGFDLFPKKDSHSHGFVNFARQFQLMVGDPENAILLFSQGGAQHKPRQGGPDFSDSSLTYVGDVGNVVSQEFTKPKSAVWMAGYDKLPSEFSAEDKFVDQLMGGPGDSILMHYTKQNFDGENGKYKLFMPEPVYLNPKGLGQNGVVKIGMKGPVDDGSDGGNANCFHAGKKDCHSVISVRKSATSPEGNVSIFSNDFVDVALYISGNLKVDSIDAKIGIMQNDLNRNVSICDNTWRELARKVVDKFNVPNQLLAQSTVQFFYPGKGFLKLVHEENGVPENEVYASAVGGRYNPHFQVSIQFGDIGVANDFGLSGNDELILYAKCEPNSIGIDSVGFVDEGFNLDSLNQINGYGPVFVSINQNQKLLSGVERLAALGVDLDVAELDLSVHHSSYARQLFVKTFGGKTVLSADSSAQTLIQTLPPVDIPTLVSGNFTQFTQNIIAFRNYEDEDVFNNEGPDGKPWLDFPGAMIEAVTAVGLPSSMSYVRIGSGKGVYGFLKASSIEANNTYLDSDLIIESPRFKKPNNDEAVFKLSDKKNFGHLYIYPTYDFPGVELGSPIGEVVNIQPCSGFQNTTLTTPHTTTNSFFKCDSKNGEDINIRQSGNLFFGTGLNALDGVLVAGKVEEVDIEDTVNSERVMSSMNKGVQILHNVGINSTPDSDASLYVNGDLFVSGTIDGGYPGAMHHWSCQTLNSCDFPVKQLVVSEQTAEALINDPSIGPVTPTVNQIRFSTGVSNNAITGGFVPIYLKKDFRYEGYVVFSGSFMSRRNSYLRVTAGLTNVSSRPFPDPDTDEACYYSDNVDYEEFGLTYVSMPVEYTFTGEVSTYPVAFNFNFNSPIAGGCYFLDLYFQVMSLDSKGSDNAGVVLNPNHSIDYGEAGTLPSNIQSYYGNQACNLSDCSSSSGKFQFDHVSEMSMIFYAIPLGG